MTFNPSPGNVHLISALALALVGAPHVGAQWVKPAPSGAPRTPDGKVYTAGDVTSEVSIQSVSKVFTMARVLQQSGEKAIELAQPVVVRERSRVPVSTS